MLQDSGAEMDAVMDVVNFYPHQCLVRRSTGQVDDNGDEVFSVVYEGEGGLQYSSGSGHTSLQGGVYYNSPLLVIPDATIIAQTDDRVDVVDENGREYRFTVNQAEAIHDTEIGGCNLWLKKGDSL